MKKILVSPDSEITHMGTTLPFSPKAQFIGLLSNAQDPRNLLSVADIRTSIKILDQLEILDGAKGGALVLEEPQYAYFLDKITSARFMLAHRAISDLVEAVEKAETFTPPSAA